jgi:glutathione peroxidase
MSSRISRTFAQSALIQALSVTVTTAIAASCPAFLDHEFRKLHSEESVNLCKIADGKPLLIVNTASHCGFTPQFKGLEALHERYKDRGLVVVGFPSDDFKQEARDENETAEVCYINYGVKFTMLAPTAVRGSDANPVFRELNQRTEAPSWNFNKYLVSADGKSVEHFGSMTTPDAPELQNAINKVLPAQAAAKP